MQRSGVNRHTAAYGSSYKQMGYGNQSQTSPVRASGQKTRLVSASSYAYGNPARQSLQVKSSSATRGVATRSSMRKTLNEKSSTASITKSGRTLNSSPLIEIIEQRLYFVSSPKPPTSQVDAYFFSIDHDLVYDPFNNDFGPLNLAHVHKFVRELVRLLSDPKFKDNRLYHYCSNKCDKQANAAFLMGCFMIIVLKIPASEAWAAFAPYHSQFLPYRDASYALHCSYPCTIEHCLQGLEYAIKLGWYDFRKFDNKEYEYYERVENGDLNWIIPGKFIAFMGPLDNVSRFERRGNTPEDYLQVFKHFGVSRVVRLNEAKYDRNKFLKAGIQHSDLYFLDGSTPPQHIVDEFLSLTEKEPGAIAIHCKAGLGRTGTLIGLYAMKHFQFPAAAFIGWIRIARPGSILGPQQHYLIENEAKYLGEHSPARQYTTKMKLEMSPEDKRRSLYGEYRQGDGLVDRKLTSPQRNAQRNNSKGAAYYD